MSKNLINWQYFPKHSQAPTGLLRVVECFKDAAEKIQSKGNVGQTSNEVLAKLRPGLQSIGFQVGTVVKHDGRWWMFHALPGPDDRAMRELHIAWADSLTGLWAAHPGNPVMGGFQTSRPGGSAFVHDGALHLPVQDCAVTYGAAINLLRIDVLSPDAFSAVVVKRFEPGHLLDGYGDGFHTLSGQGDVTFIDVKGIRQSSAEPWLKAGFKARRLLGLNGPRGRRATGAAVHPEIFSTVSVRKQG